MKKPWILATVIFCSLVGTGLSAKAIPFSSLRSATESVGKFASLAPRALPSLKQPFQHMTPTGEKFSSLPTIHQDKQTVKRKFLKIDDFVVIPPLAPFQTREIYGLPILPYEIASKLKLSGTSCVQVTPCNLDALQDPKFWEKTGGDAPKRNGGTLETIALVYAYSQKWIDLETAEPIKTAACSFVVTDWIRKAYAIQNDEPTQQKKALDFWIQEKSVTPETALKVARIAAESLASHIAQRPAISAEEKDFFGYVRPQDKHREELSAALSSYEQAYNAYNSWTGSAIRTASFISSWWK